MWRDESGRMISLSASGEVYGMRDWHQARAHLSDQPPQSERSAPEHADSTCSLHFFLDAGPVRCSLAGLVQPRRRGLLVSSNLDSTECDDC